MGALALSVAPAPPATADPGRGIVALRLSYVTRPGDPSVRVVPFTDAVYAFFEHPYPWLGLRLGFIGLPR